MKLTSRELATVLAALRYWQEQTQEEERDEFEHFDDENTALGDEEIDELCEKINFDD